MATRAFRCPLCGGGLFRSVVVPRADGSQYLTSFYECAGCSVMFIDPSAFNANEPGPPSSAGVKLPPASPSMSLESYSKAVSAPDAVSHSAARRNGESER
jgi:hypothetical protein